MKSDFIYFAVICIAGWALYFALNIARPGHYGEWMDAAAKAQS